MGAETHIDLDGIPHAIDTSGPEWTLELRRSLVAVRDAAELDLLAHGHDALLPCRVTPGEDSITLHLTPVDGAVPWTDVLRLPRAERLRALANVAACAALVDRGYAVLLHPGNLLVDRNLRPLLAYRGLAGLMPPRAADDQHLLRQYQALVLSTMDPKASFTELLQGALSLRRSSAFEKAVTAAASVDELAGYLTGLYDETVATESARLVRVGRRSHTTFKHAAIWLGVLALAAGATAVWAVFVQAPFDARMLRSGTQFVAMDYDGVIETLRPVEEERLPLTQRYQLAYSYLRGTNLSADQRAAIENNLSLSSERDFLTYWVEIGRGDIEDALDRAKGLDDLDLILYAITLRQEQVRSEPAVTGAERESALTELQAEYDTYLEARTTAVDGDPEAQDEAAVDGDPDVQDEADAPATEDPEA